MGADAEDEALSWGGEADPTHVDSPTPDAAAADETGFAAGVSSPMLVVYGVFGGIYLLYTVGWLIIALRGSQTTGVPLNDIMLHLSTLLAVAAAPAWFIATLALAPTRRTWLRVAVLVLGILVLIPWGFVSGGGR
jgi:hypothetical protein